MSKSAMHFEIALVEAIQEALVVGAELSVPGLGTFSIVHRPANIREGSQNAVDSSESENSSENDFDSDFSAIIQPPENCISFLAASDDDNFPEFKSTLRSKDHSKNIQKCRCFQEITF